MKISNDTLTILKNFASINPSFRFTKGNVIRTCSPDKAIMAIATVQESFPLECGIYDMPQLLGVLSSGFDAADLSFEKEYLMISEAESDSYKLRYAYTNTKNIIFPPDNLKLDITDPIEFNLPKETLAKVFSVISQLRVQNIVIRGIDGTVFLVGTTFTPTNKNGNEFKVPIAKTKDTFEFVFNVDNLKFVSDSFKVSISRDCTKAKFECSSIQYWVAVEFDSYLKS